MFLHPKEFIQVCDISSDCWSMSWFAGQVVLLFFSAGLVGLACDCWNVSCYFRVFLWMKGHRLNDITCICRGQEDLWLSVSVNECLLLALSSSVCVFYFIRVWVIPSQMVFYGTSSLPTMQRGSRVPREAAACPFTAANSLSAAFVLSLTAQRRREKSGGDVKLPRTQAAVWGDRFLSETLDYLKLL